MKKIMTMLGLALALAATAPAARADNPLEALGGLISNATAKSNFELADLHGTWNYSSPAISFKSDNALNKIGGIAAQAAVEGKLAPYYKRIGLNTAVLTVDDQDNFTLKFKFGTLQGTIEKGEAEGQLVFNVKAMGKMNLGKVSAMAAISKVDKSVSLTFDASHIIAVVKKVAEVSKNAQVESLSKLLSSYDGIYAGAKFKKQ